MNSNKGPVYVNITALAFIKIILILVVFYFLFLIKDVLAILFVSLILSSAIDPSIDWMQSKKIPRGIGVIFIYLSIFTLVGGVVYLMIPPIITEVNQLSRDFPLIFEKVVSGFSILRDFALQYDIIDNVKEYFGGLTENLQSAAGSVFSTIAGIFGGIISFFLILVITFYMVVEENAMKKIVWSIAPPRYQPYIMDLINRMQHKIGLWLRGQIILSVIIFMLTYIGLKILGVKYALVLALIAGLTEFVPYLGPILAAIPAVFIAFTQAWTLAIFTAILYYIIQLVENNIIVPKLMQKVVGLNPIVSIAVLLIGFKIGGIVGAILAIPVATAVSVFIRDVFEHKKMEID